MALDSEELLHIFVSVIAISLALTIFSAPSLSQLTGKFFASAMIVFTIAVGSGFVLHELMHRYFARKFGAWAGYRAWTEGLVLMLALSLLPLFTGIRFMFLAPGAVYIISARGITRQENGIISLAGPVTNMVLAGVFFAAFLGAVMLFPSANLFSALKTGTGIFSSFDLLSVAEKIAYIGLIGFSVNMNLAFFNLLPIPPLDGSKVIAWDFKIWLVAIAIPFLLSGVI